METPEQKNQYPHQTPTEDTSQNLRKNFDDDAGAYTLFHETIDRINEKLYQIYQNGNLIPLFQTYNIELKKSGASYRGRCPRHDGNSPSFLVSGHKSYVKCFGCGHGGSLRNVLLQLEFWEKVTPRIRRLRQLERHLDDFLLPF